MQTIVILAYENAQILDIAGPASVFGEANTLGDADHYEIVIASVNGQQAQVGMGMVLQPRSLREYQTQQIDTLIVPGAMSGSLAAVLHDDLLAATVKSLPRPRRITSVCTGAFLLAKWGFLEGKKATTHWEAAQDLKRTNPNITVDSDALFIEDGDVWTSAGVSTGIDMSLAMVEQDCGRYLASRIARRLVLQARRDGNQSQYSEVLAAQAGEFGDLVGWIRQNLMEDLTVPRLAERSNLSERTFYRRFLVETDENPATFVRRLRVEAARSFLDAGVSAKQVAVKVGFGSTDALRRAYLSVYGRKLND